MVRPLVSVLAAAALLSESPLCRGALAAEPEVIDGIAAVVKLNEASSADVITYSEVRDVSAPKEKLLRDQYRGEELVTKIKEARAEALKDLIDRQLIVQAFKKEGYQIPDHYLDQRVQDIIRDNFNGDRNTFIKTLQAQTFTLGEFRKLETEKMIVQAMRHKNVEVNTIISPNKIQDYYRKHAAEFTSKEQVKLRMIMISAGTSDRAGQKAMAEEVLSKLVNGAEFDRMAQIYSEDSTRDLGGDWGWIDRGTLTAPSRKSRSAYDSVKSATSSKSAVTITFSKSKVDRAALPDLLPRFAMKLRKNSPAKKHKRCRNAGSPVCARKLTLRCIEVP
jgi:PPIC-type PPIASE domain.